MAEIYWPVALPLRPQGGSYKITPQNNRVSFEPEVGPTLDRRRSTSTNITVTADFDLTSFYMKTVFEEWYKDELMDGILPFMWEDPTECVEYEWKFYGKSAPYSIVANRGIFMILSVNLMRL
ncbi:MAG: hypothetical protein WC100_06970 [Sterolibacterium sp.]